MIIQIETKYKERYKKTARGKERKKGIRRERRSKEEVRGGVKKKMYE